MIAVVAPEGTTTLSMPDVILITPIGESFWRKLDGSIDMGFSYTQSSDIAQLNLNSDTIYRKPAFQIRLSASVTQTRQNEGEGGERSGDDRGSLDAAYLRYPWRRGSSQAVRDSRPTRAWPRTGGRRLVWRRPARVITAIERSQLAAVWSPTTSAEWTSSRRRTSRPPHFVRRLHLRSPRTTVDVSLNYYPSVSNAGRHRLQLTRFQA
jgi:hypothetical protein